MTDTPRVGDHLSSTQQPRDVVGELTGSARLRAALVDMYAVGNDANDRHDQAVDSLRRDPEETIVAIVAAYGGCPAGDYAQRQALVRVAGILGHSGSLPFLASVALAEIPQEQAADPHSFSTVAEETIIRMTAVDGIVQRARDGDEGAAEFLMKCVESPSFSVRRAAVSGLMSTPYGDERRSDIEARVPSEQRFIFDLKQIPASEAIQVEDPTRHLAERYREPSEPKPAIPGQAGTGGQRPTTRG
jgi:hypothetical protein